MGAEYFICDGKSIPRFQETWTTEMARAFHHFGNARFDLMMASDVLTHEVGRAGPAVPQRLRLGLLVAQLLPGDDREDRRPARADGPDDQVRRVPLRRLLRRVDLRQAPGREEGDGRRPARLVEAGFYEEDELPPILHQILHDTPRDLYDLGPRTDLRLPGRPSPRRCAARRSGRNRVSENNLLLLVTFCIDLK